MVPKLKSRRYKKRRIVSSKKRRQPKTRTKRYRRKTRKTRGGVKRSVPSTPTQEYGEYNGEPVAPRKNRTRAVGDAVVGANLFQGFPENQENINPQIPMVTPPQTPMQGVQPPVFTPVQEPLPPAQQQENNLFAQGHVTPQGNLNDDMEDAYMESITTPYGARRYNDATYRMYDEDTEEEDDI